MALKSQRWQPCGPCGSTGMRTRTEIQLKDGKPHRVTIHFICDVCNGYGGKYI